MGLLDVDTTELVQDHRVLEFVGSPQKYSLSGMTEKLVGYDFWDKLMGGRRGGEDFLAKLQGMMGGQIWLTGSAVREVWPGYTSTEADRLLPQKMDQSIVAAVKWGVFGGELEIGKLLPAQYLGVQLATFACLPENMDFRSNKTIYSNVEAWDVIDLLTERFASEMGDNWHGCVIERDGTKELVFINQDEKVAAVCFYFKERERSGGGVLTTLEWESNLSSRELQRRVEIHRTENGNLAGESPGLLGRKSDVTYSGSESILSTGQRMEQLAKAMREIAMTGRIPRQLKVESFGDVSQLEDRWNLRQWLVYVGSLAQAIEQDPVETREMLKMIGADLDEKIDSSEWREVLEQGDRVLAGLGQVVPGGGKGMKLADLAPLVAMLSPKGFGVKEVLAMVPEPDERESSESSIDNSPKTV